MLKASYVVLLIIVISHLRESFGLEIPLNNRWTISNANGSIVVKEQNLPSGVYSALENANITGSVLNSYNDVKLRWIAYEKWTYTLNFDVQKDFKKISCGFLVFHGLDTIANIFFNEKPLSPDTNNMFVRYRYNVLSELKTKNNSIKVVFKSPVTVAKSIAESSNFTPPECPPSRYNGECHMNFIRKMQASFSWDWGLAAPSVGIWKPVVLELYDTAIIRDITYSLRTHDDLWIVDIKTHMETNSDQLSRFEGNFFINIANVFKTTIIHHTFLSHLTKDEFDYQFTVNISKKDVDLWWPNGYGEQPLYDLSITWQGESRDVDTNVVKDVPEEYLTSTKTVKIGFRTIELVEDKLDTGNSFYFKVNNVSMFVKGTNWIPLDILPEKSFNQQKIQHLLSASKDAHMNAIRVWGGGLYESDYFYELADKYGILIWQDMMFACAMYPVYPEFKSSVRIEIGQNIRRLQSHPSILLWTGNNENEAALVQNWYGTVLENDRFKKEYIELYDEIIRPVVENNDKWHLWLYSSPSNGRTTNKIIHDNPQDNKYGDIHFYDYIFDGWNPNIFPKPRFVSEYGFQSFPSINSWESVIGAKDNLGDLIDHRQHFPLGSVPIKLSIGRHLPVLKENEPHYWNSVIYFSQISQAMATKTETEVYRVNAIGEAKTMGALYWQLNDVWVAPSWSSIEFNGNFKILHNWAKEFFAPLYVVAHIDPLNEVSIFALRDTLGGPLALEVVLDVFSWSGLNSRAQKKWKINLLENSVLLVEKTSVSTYIPPGLSKSDCFLRIQMKDQDSAVLATNFVLLENIKDSLGIIRPHQQIEITRGGCNSTTLLQQVNLKISVSAPAIFLYIQLHHPEIEKYHLSKNGFIQVDPVEYVNVTITNPNCSAVVQEEHFKIQTVNDHMMNGNNTLENWFERKD